MSDPALAYRFTYMRLKNTPLKMCLMSCPGIRFERGKAASKVDYLVQDVERLVRHDVKMVLSCLCDEEFGLGRDCYEYAYTMAGMDWHKVPIADMTAPNSAGDRSLDGVFRKARSVMENGAPIAIHCMGGLGRTGTVAARLAMQFGLSAEQAIDHIRIGHDGAAIETEGQEAYLRAYRPCGMRTVRGPLS